MPNWLPWACVLSLALLAGCGERNTTPVTVRPPVPPGKGVIAGTVTLASKPPVMREVPNSACHPGGPPVREESVVADDEGRLANVVVYLKDGPPVDVPAGGLVVLDQ